MEEAFEAVIKFAGIPQGQDNYVIDLTPFVIRATAK